MASVEQQDRDFRNHSKMPEGKIAALQSARCLQGICTAIGNDVAKEENDSAFASVPGHTAATLVSELRRVLLSKVR